MKGWMGVAAICYCLRLLRPLCPHESVFLWWAGFLPSFGAGLGGPLAFLWMRRLWVREPGKNLEKQWFEAVCIGCLLFLVVHETIDGSGWRPQRVFDWWDMGASVAGCVVALWTEKVN